MSQGKRLMDLDLTILTEDEQKRALCLACERSLLSGQCKCANPNWVLAVEDLTLLPGDASALASLPFGKKRQLARPKRGNKYHAVRSKSVITKRWYDSGAERDFRDVLTIREADGLITDIVEQPVTELGPDGEIKYRADFTYLQITNPRQVWVDVKGVETERFRIIKKLWRYNGPGPLEIVKRKGKGKPFLVTQTIMPIT